MGIDPETWLIIQLFPALHFKEDIFQSITRMFDQFTFYVMESKVSLPTGHVGWSA
jgi:hypothetical protein